MSFLKKLFTRDKKEELNTAVEKTKEGMLSRLAKAVAGKSKVDIDILDEIEEILVSSDVGIDTTVKIIDRIEARVAKDKYMNANELNALLKDEVVELLRESNKEDLGDFDLPTHARPYVIMVVGVNGVGKTTTIGKLAHQYKSKGLNVLLGAGDTFRAAAIDQLDVWAKRAEVDIIKKQTGDDPASVAFDTVTAGVARNADVIIIDTAGRLHNKVGLMDELTKIKRVMQKVIPDAPHEVLLVLDASTGQNAIEQAKQFTAATDVTALALTKLDGTAKGGVVLAIMDLFKIPVKYIGTGEKMNQLQIFNKEEFVDSLFGAWAAA